MVADAINMDQFDYAPLKPKEANEMDVPKITVFKSPPWHKHAPNLLTPKLSDVYEVFPSKSKVFSRRITVGISRSLECIPENNILQDTHKYSTTHLRDSQRLSPHQVLPPIQRCGDDDLPEMRQRAYSDPHRYSQKKSEERRESPLAKLKPSPQPVPPKEKPDPTHHSSHILSQSTHKVQRKALHKDTPDRKSPSKVHFRSPVVTPASPSTDYRQHSPLVIKPPNTPKDTKMAPVLSRRKTPDTNSNPGTPENRVIRNKKLLTKNVSAEAIISHPTVAALKDKSHGRSRTNSLPASLKGTKKPTKKSNTLEPLKVEDEVRTTVAYALIASPGRNRWPSPERNATSYINSSDSSGSATPTDSCRQTDSADSLEAMHKITPGPRIEHKPSDAFKTILQDLKSSSRVETDLYSITDPKEYFQRAANWGSTV